MSRILFLKIAVLLLSISFLVYGNSIFNQFVWDDYYLIEQNPYIKNFKYIEEIFSSDVGMVTSTRTPAGTYRPISMLSFMIDYKIWKLEPIGYHLTNVLIHSLNSILLFLLFYFVSKEKIVSFLSALIFTVHPIHTEAVSVIFNRMGLLVCFFMLISFIFYIKAAELKKIEYLFLSVIFFLLSLLSKETAIFFVFLLMSYDYYFVSNQNIKMFFKRTPFYLIYFLVILFYLILRKIFISQELAFGIWLNSAFLSIPFYLKILTTFNIIASYIKLLFFPINLSAMYLVTTAKLNFITIFSGVLISTLLILAYLRRRQNKLVSFFIVFFFITILPFALVIPFGVRFNERFLYLPSVGFCFILGYFLQVMFSKAGKNSLGVVRLKTLVSLTLICLLFFYACQTIKRNYDWRSNLWLWQETVSTCPVSAEAHANLGYAYLDLHLYDKAIEEFLKSLSLKPNQFRVCIGIGKVFLAKEDFENSLIYFKKAGELSMDTPLLHNDIGIAYSYLGNFDMALVSFKKAIELWNKFPEPFYNIGVLYCNQDNLVKAKYYFQKASSLNPDNPNFRYHLNIVNRKLLNEK